MKYYNLLLLPLLTACAGTPPDNLGIIQGKLSSCPESPNCVSSYSSNDTHKISPLKSSIEEIQQILISQDRVKIITQNEHYLYAEFTSKLMRYVDDVEFYYVPEEQVVHVRSASRLGKSDMGVNRKRIEHIRTLIK